LNKGEVNQALEEILPIVLYVYATSSLSLQLGGQIPSKLFFVYNQIDTSQEAKGKELLQDLTKKQIRRGLILSLTNTSTLHQRFTAKIYVLNQEQGGRHTPFFQTYQPQIHSRTCSVRTKLTFPQTIQKVMPGDKVELTFQLCKSIVIQQDDPIFICEGHQLIATGTILQILD